eukprot:Unigene760_Nuclearia_a/m.2452 Unigene760_Nuclearia_a/g.2452  ORF Unigene760_Nuclearia_a/g.2452 Unigene760_Nuclearia_a/m.2452 type:complete len:449 (-) Unigene760_Nuclearia_a:147-1493(-)
MRYAAVSVVAALLLVGAARAQVASQGKWTPRTALNAAQRLDVEQSTFRLPKQDNAALLATEDASHGGYQFGTPVDVALTPNNAGRVFHFGEGNVWVLKIASEGALSLSVIFDKFRLPEGAELYAYNDETVLGAFTAKNNKAHGKFSIMPLEGDSMTLELYVPATSVGEVVLSIWKITHGYKTLAYGSSGRCNVNVACAEGDAWRAQIRGAAMMLTAFGSRYCSGSMINNALNDGRQLFLTADHCTSGDMYTDRLLFNYQSPTCSPQSDGPTTNSVSGLRTLAEYSASDFSLFEVEEEIPASYNVYLNGFSAVNTPARSMVGIHHPSGDIKKISFANKTAEAARWSAAEPGLYHWEVSSWDLGTTEPGSSGSPLFDQNQRIVGQLHGGAAACGNSLYDSYGAVWASWDKGTQKLQPHLDPRNSGTLSVDGINLNDARARRDSHGKVVPK